MNLEPFRQRLIEFRRHPLEPEEDVEICLAQGIWVNRRKASHWRHAQVCDDLDDLIREVERLRVEVAALREELDNLQDGAD